MIKESNLFLLAYTLFVEAIILQSFLFQGILADENVAYNSQVNTPMTLILLVTTIFIQLKVIISIIKK